MNNEKLGVQDVRIIYTKSYKVMDNKIVFFEEHVFPIVKKNNYWFSADAFYSKKKPYSIYYINVHIKLIKKEELPANAPLEMKEAKVVLRCGKIFRNNKIEGEIYNIPIYFTNSFNVIEENIISNPKLFYIFNRPLLPGFEFSSLEF